jgi:hypothetical protein
MNNFSTMGKGVNHSHPIPIFQKAAAAPPLPHHSE